MNPKNTLLGIGLVLALLAPALRADDAAYAAILKERDTVLTKIVADAECRHAEGAADDAVWSAKLALLTFRRDAAPAVGEKLKQQELIVALQEERLGLLKARAQSGTISSLDVLRATDALLAAKQLLAEIQRDGKLPQP